ncbi:hypothetical protein S1OALGB6SA_225 [Olavius algarvensis spirochete endosymbiont]|uniref:hypothetical protein n=1 Tax=Olavius algarvensis spirochete endosymbiont TaxID=260710 RepID=UPI00052BF90A|nr:hypothetical protein [Olavius algarvensis spirochete endosymbiont]KGM44150.1 hypothetical protein JY97_02660 [Alkalispirochaeta odontotermitis]CAD7839128.1 MAG: hypothetical protein [Olavius algarvensis spirochete endosymbiont]VDA99162.1 hypothetical protein S1OALGB6SA_225 [Olavius algarvensis spirochete endosymbiont]
MQGNRYPSQRIETLSTFLFSILLLLSSTPSGAQDSNLELRLNNITHVIIDPANFQIGMKDIPLQSLFPYLESVEHLEAKSEQSSLLWNATSLGPAGWDEAFLTYRNQTWELHVGSNSFAAPHRISVHGIRRPISLVQIWSSIQTPQYKSNLSATLALRDVEVKWKSVSKLANRLENPPPQGMPHLVVIDQLHLLRLKPLLTSPQPIMARLSRWYSTSPDGTNSKGIFIDAYHPESALLYLLADNPNLFDKHNQLPLSLITFLNRILFTEDLVVSASPMTALVNSINNQITGAVRLPSSREKETGDAFVEVEPPTGAKNIIRYIYATIPAGISDEKRELAKLILEDAIRIADLTVPANAVAIPQDFRILRFFDSYTRIARLTISNQISVTEAAELINAYVTGD